MIKSCPRNICRHKNMYIICIYYKNNKNIINKKGITFASNKNGLEGKIVPVRNMYLIIRVRIWYKGWDITLGEIKFIQIFPESWMWKMHRLENNVKGFYAREYISDRKVELFHQIQL